LLVWKVGEQSIKIKTQNPSLMYNLLILFKSNSEKSRDVGNMKYQESYQHSETSLTQIAQTKKHNELLKQNSIHTLFTIQTRTLSFCVWMSHFKI
jgi:hypothetical protein